MTGTSGHVNDVYLVNVATLDLSIIRLWLALQVTAQTRVSLAKSAAIMGGLSAPEETSKSQFECSEGRGSGAASNSQSRQASGACGHSVWRRLCSNRLLIIALMLIWILLAVFIVLFIISPREVRNTSRTRYRMFDYLI